MDSNLSRIIAGTMTWGSWGKNLSVQQMAAMIDCCLENGIHSFDHADIYGGYTTEDAFGQALGESRADRDDIKIISKCGIQYPSEKKPFRVKHYKYSKSHIIASVDDSLKNLRTDHLDLLLLHRPSPLMRAEEITNALASLHREGKIKNFGLSNFSPSQTELIRKHVPVAYNQIQFSVTHPDAMTNGDLDYMMLHHIRPMAWNPLGNVFREETPQSERIKKVLVPLMAKYDAPADVILLAWILKHPAGIYPVFGTASPDRIRELPKALNIHMETEDWFWLWTEARGTRVP